MPLWGNQKQPIERLCPSCSKKFFPGECDIYGRLAEEPDKPLKKVQFNSDKERQYARANPEPLTGPEYTELDAYRKCPYCQYALPYNIEQARNLSIVIVGDTGSGKSHYLAALIHQIEQGLLAGNVQGIRFTPLTREAIKKHTKEYFITLFDSGEAIPPTDLKKPKERNEPLIYRLILKADKEHLAQSVNLIFYDAAGEEFVDPELLVRKSLYVLNADAMIFLVDPVAVPEIARRLPAHLHYPATQQKDSVTTHFETILAAYERYNKYVEGSSRLPIPIAITMSKSDLLGYLVATNEPFSFLENPLYYKGGVDLEDVERVNLEVQTILKEYGGRSLLNATSYLEPIKYFAVSATGHPPDEHGSYPVVEPGRCLDPMLWLLYKLGVVKDSNYIR